ncbi:TonB-dependent receptor domain-containing protein [Arcticibacter tournemirensis]
MKVLTTIYFFFFLCTISTFGQSPETGTLSGKLIDASTERVIDYATVAVINKSTGKTTKTTQTNTNGIFNIPALHPGTYILKISFVGYKPYTQDPLILTPAQPSLDLGTIKLQAGKSSILNEVVVQGQRSTIQLGVDRKIFSVDQSIVSEGGSATDLLANVPTVSVDIDGNVSLRGTGNVRILIDGKPSAIGGGDIASVLQSLPASSIENIELITNPSAKYDPEGQTGIINIVLKKNKKLGSNGSVAISAGNRDNYNASTNLSYRSGKLNLYGNYSYRYSNRYGGGFNNTTFRDSNRVVNNVSDARRQNISNTAKIGFDYYINEKTTIGASGNLSFRDGKDSEHIDYLYQNYSNNLDGTSRRASTENEEDSGYDLSLDFSRKFKRQGEELTSNFSFGSREENEDETFNQDFYQFSGAKRDTMDRRISKNKEAGDNYNIQIDYTLPFSQEQRLEAGYRTTIRNSDESQVSDVYNYRTDRFTRDYNLTNDFTLEDIVHAAYASYQNQITKTFGFQIGLRAEQAYLNTEYRNTDTATMQIRSTEGKLDYFRVYPGIFLTQKLKNDNQLQLSYTRRINRPRGWQVNPFRDVSDPNNIRVGNPNLKPEDIHSFEFSYMKYWKSFTLTSSVYFRQVNDVVEGIQLQIDSITTLTQFSNLSRNQAGGLEIIGRADIAKGVNVTANANVFYNKFFGSEEFNIESNSGYNWTGNLTTNISLSPNLSTQINMNYMSHQVTAQGSRRAMFGTDAAVKMDVLKKKGSISFNMRDVFNSRKWGMTTETAAFTRQFQRRMQGRMGTLTFSYRFGNTEQQQRNRKNDRNNQEQQGGVPGEEF